MSDAEIEKRLANMKICAEAEKALRQCRAYIERLRREKKLGYTSSPPASIDEKYLEIYVARAKQRRVSIKPKRGDSSVAAKKEYRVVPAGAVPGPFNLLTIAEIASKSGRTAKKIRYLCLHGLIPYLAGEPRLIDEIDVTKHFERKRVAKLTRTPGTPEFEAARLREILQQKRHKALRARIRSELKPVLERVRAEIAAGTYRPGGLRKK